MQDLHLAVFGVAAEADHGGDVEVEFPERFRQAVRAPVLLLVGDAGTGTEVADEIGLGEDDSAAR